MMRRVSSPVLRGGRYGDVRSLTRPILEAGVKAEEYYKPDTVSREQVPTDSKTKM